ncbi:MAG: hypothetical protein IJL71_02195 [Oscillospiraceae bacterium]|nr:hypothetical protein [Oscillospiraceae bacterium]
MSGEIYVSFGGDELELRDISAAEYLSAGAEAGKLYRESGNESAAARAVILGACLLSRGLYSGDGRAYATAKDVLEAVTAEEILETARYAGIDADMVKKFIESADRMMKRASDPGINAASSDKDYSASERGGFGFDGIAGASKERFDPTEGEGAYDYKKASDHNPDPAQYAGQSDLRKTDYTTDGNHVTGDMVDGNERLPDGTDRRRGYDLIDRVMNDDPAGKASVKLPFEHKTYIPERDDIVSAQSNPYEMLSRSLYRAALQPRDDMRRVSDFFQRDSRRYDGIITMY